MYLALFVDDGMIMSDDLSEIDKIVLALEKEFEIKVGSADIFIGMQIIRDKKNRSIMIHQEAYAGQLIEKFNMDDAVACTKRLNQA